MSLNAIFATSSRSTGRSGSIQLSVGFDPLGDASGQRINAIGPTSDGHWIEIVFEPVPGSNPARPSTNVVTAFPIEIDDG